jgi:hypothetical protein
MIEHTETSPFPDAPPQIRARHRQGLALVYVRHPSTEQVRDHTGSTASQLALADLPRTWGRPEDRVIILNDAGLSGTTTDRAV